MITDILGKLVLCPSTEELPGSEAPMYNKNRKIGSPCMLFLVILNGGEQICPVITTAKGLAYCISIILMKLEPFHIRSKTDQRYDNSSLSNSFFCIER